MENSLESILSGSPAEPRTTEVVQQHEVQPPQTGESDQQGTGEEQTAPPAAQQKDDPLEKHRKGLEAAAAAERKRRQDAEARAEAAERRARELEQQHRQPPKQHQEQQDEDPKPLRANFASEDEWLDARDAWRDRQREASAAMERAERQARETFEKTESIYAQAQALEGFDRTSFDSLPLTRAIVEALVESEKAPELMAYMASHRDEVAAIAQMQSPARQIAAMARIEDKLNAAPAAQDDDDEDSPPAARKPLPKTLTQARNAAGRFEPAYAGPTPLNAILASK